MKHVTSPCFLWITGRWWSVWWSHCLVSPRSHTAPSPGNTHGWITECFHMIKWIHTYIHTLTLMASSAVRRLSFSVGSVVCFTSSCSHKQTNYRRTGKMYMHGGNAAAYTRKQNTHLYKHTCNSRWYLRTRCIGTMSKSRRVKRPLFALFEHS